MPLAIILSIVAVTVFYVLVNVAYYTMMTPAEVLLSDAVAVVSSISCFMYHLKKKEKLE